MSIIWKHLRAKTTSLKTFYIERNRNLIETKYRQDLYLISQPGTRYRGRQATSARWLTPLIQRDTAINDTTTTHIKVSAGDMGVVCGAEHPGDIRMCFPQDLGGVRHLIGNPLPLAIQGQTQSTPRKDLSCPFRTFA